MLIAGYDLSGTLVSYKGLSSGGDDREHCRGWRG